METQQQVFVDATVYILQLSPEKMDKDNQRLFKAYLMQIIDSIKEQDRLLVIEVYFYEKILMEGEEAKDDQMVENLKNSIGQIMKLVTNGYNLLEPEHSTKYPLQQVEILMP